MRDVSKFKLLDIKGDCFDILVASFTNWIKGEYRFLFCECLGFEYIQNNLCVGKGIYVKKGDIINQVFDNGLLVEFYINICESELKFLLESFNPLIMEFDCYDCYWRDTYRKLHNSHYVIIWNYDKALNELICMDTFPEIHNLKIDCSFAVKKAKRTLVFRENVGKFQLYTPQKCLAKLVSCIRPSYRIIMVEQMQKFIRKLPDSIDLRKEMCGYENLEIFHIPIISNLKRLSWSFSQFQYLLEYVCDEKLNDCYVLANNIIENFEIMINYIILVIIRKEQILMTKTLKKYLGKVVYQEEILMKKLLIYCDYYEDTSYNSSL